MLKELASEDIAVLVDGLNLSEKVERSRRLISEAYEEFGDRMVIANSLGKDSVAGILQRGSVQRSAASSSLRATCPLRRSSS